MVKKAIVYNTKKEKKAGEEKGRKRKKERERERERERTKRLKKYNSKKEEYSTLRLIIRACPRILSGDARR